MEIAAKPQTPKAGPAEFLRVALVDDEEDMRFYLSELLAQAPQIKCVGVFASGEAALTGVPTAQPEVLLMDVRMPGLSGIECSKRLKQRYPRLVIVAMTGSLDQQTMREAAVAGVDDYLQKPIDGERIITRLQFLMLQKGARLPAPAVASCWSAATTSIAATGPGSRPLDSWVMGLMAQGRLDKEIADLVGISQAKVKKVLRRNFLQLGARNRAEATSRWRAESGE